MLSEAKHLPFEYDKQAARWFICLTDEMISDLEKGLNPGDEKRQLSGQEKHDTIAIYQKAKTVYQGVLDE